MKHIWDITKIDGAAVEPVDCITFGSPCQDLSVAGKRAGLSGERSGLFMEAVRIIKEVRLHDGADGRADEFIRPRFAVWENVAGAFISNHGGDFRAVLEELARIKQADATIPQPAKWSKAGTISGGGWSIAWRTIDAQYWGVPQRRRRIALVVDFAGQRAAEILFERQGVQGDFAQSESPWKDIAGNPLHSVDAYDRAVFGIGSFHSNAMMSNNPRSGFYEADTSRTLDLNGGTPACNQGGMAICQKISEPHLYDMSHGCDVIRDCGTVAPNLQARMGTGGNQIPLTVEHPAYGLDRASFNQGQNAKYDFSVLEEQQPTITARGPGAVCEHWIVRRLTPTECERLQGFPDGWTDICEWTDTKGKHHKPADSPRYKALGNSIALPQWWWLICKMAAHLPDHATLGSLFDGIGGFPLVWETRHGKGTARWASEIEEFPIAVTKYHFPEE